MFHYSPQYFTPGCNSKLPRVTFMKWLIYCACSDYFGQLKTVPSRSSDKGPAVVDKCHGDHQTTRERAGCPYVFHSLYVCEPEIPLVQQTTAWLLPPQSHWKWALSGFSSLLLELELEPVSLCEWTISQSTPWELALVFDCIVLKSQLEIFFFPVKLWSHSVLFKTVPCCRGTASLHPFFYGLSIQLWR